MNVGWVFTESTFPLLRALFASSGSLHVFSLESSLKRPYGVWAALPVHFMRAVNDVLHASPQLHTIRVRLTNTCACTYPIDPFCPCAKPQAIGALRNYVSNCWRLCNPAFQCHNGSRRAYAPSQFSGGCLNAGHHRTTCYCR